MLVSNLKSSFAAVVLAVVVDALSSKTGSTVDVNGVYYYVPSEAISSLKLSYNQLKGAFTAGEDLIPMTVMTGDFNSLDTTTLESTIARFTAQDDVFNTGFLQAVYLLSTTPAELHASLTSTLSTYGNKLFMVSYSSNASVEAVSCTSPIPTGPYFVSAYTGNIYQAWRLYSDYEGAFTEGTYPSQSGNFTTLSASIPGVQSPTIGVPSRLYYTKTTTQPLAGVRLGIKDIYDVAGTRRGCGNRAYYSLYPERPTTAPAVQKLVDAGAIIVGKMKTSQFANGEMATADWVDYHSPFNARGDGYSDPSSSSSGPGQESEHINGWTLRWAVIQEEVYGIRHNPLMDTAGFLTRDAVLWKAASEVLYSTNLTAFTSYPKTLYTTLFPKTATTEAESILLSFLSTLETYLGVNASVLDYDSMWGNSSLAAQTQSPTLSDLLTLTYPTLISKQQYTLFGAPFIADYGAANDGRVPFIDPVPTLRWGYARSNATTLEQGIANKTIFKNWWNSEVILPDTASCTQSLLLYPGTLATPNYRNVYLEPPQIPAGWSVQNVAIFAGVPDMVLPIGQAPYYSTITNHTEYLPVAVNIVAAPGCDAVIFKIAEELQNAGIINAPKAGSTMYRRDVGLNFE
ncbi:amidase signature domain-containing protein [Halenospora varia]|nr:amidase signature domain-containing protein [Halenospora varia]